MIIHETHVGPEWVDYNGHMNDAAYARVFSQACEALIDQIGLDEAGRKLYGYTIYTLETHLCFRREAHQDQSLSVDLTLLDRDAKRLHVFFAMFDDEDNLLASSEQMLMGMDQVSGRASAFPEPVASCVAKLPQANKGLWPELAGRTIGIRR
ncbi:thioesterase family protein [Halomonas sp. SH5A2]|uniref:thioesterase family protein n=1 Tax=Halomonas sp. SH5A2 TaxID=2749040 RepID=UPI00163F2ED7|nr:thioesterase family protein [Halomonas sp. SH5A2]QNI02505.1 thioesterase family protein [Halomonas sp. SH5A2]